MAIRPSQLRANIYRLLDQVIETGEPIEIERKGHRLLLVAKPPASKIDRLVRRDDVIRGDPAELVHIDWSAECRP